MFKRTIEDFRCGNCGDAVKGNGYTNHCPKCLWSRHVDVHPGDRDEGCQGMMEPVDVQSARRSFVVVHRCISCGTVRKNRVAPPDDVAAFLSSRIPGMLP